MGVALDPVTDSGVEEAALNPNGPRSSAPKNLGHRGVPKHQVVINMQKPSSYAESRF